MEPGEVLLKALVWLAVLHALLVLLSGITQPITDWFGFRQTQTALSAFWIAKGGPWLAYETPVLGSPWSIPFEFPLYQLLVAGVTKVGLPIEVAGRLVSFGFFLGCVPAFRKIAQISRLPSHSSSIVSVLFLTSPVYLFWSRTLMIESCALFFSVWGIYYILCLIHQRCLVNLFLAAGFGSVAALVKVTTFATFLAVGGLMFLPALATAVKQRDGRSAASLIGFGFVLAATVVAVASYWISFTDALKSKNIIGALLTSDALRAWNWGTLQQRFGSGLWRDVILLRSIPETLGLAFPLTIPLLGLAVVSRRYGPAWIVLVVGYLAAFLLFTNLHTVHNYYQYSNAIFLVAAVGMSLAVLVKVWGVAAGAAFLGLVAVLQVGGYYKDFYKVAHFDPSVDGRLIISEAIRNNVPEGEGVLLIGQSWDSTIPFYAERRSLSVPGFLPRQQISRILKAPDKFFRRTRLGAVLYCYEALGEYGQNKDLFIAFAASKKVRVELPGCNILEP